ncbi:set8 [Symbiodinium sp. KB8]|nr:set8 [Symbiodinium sp. KB8]
MAKFNAMASGRDVLNVPELLEAMPACAVPPEVEAILLSMGYPEIRRCTKHKVSFHATYFLDFAGPLPSGAEGRAVLQMIGSELGDKELFHLQKPISAESIVRATALAQDAGIRVPQILASGKVESWGPLSDVPFLVYEFVNTATVEDERVAPDKDLRLAISDVQEKLKCLSLTGVNTEPLPRFEDCFEFTAYLRQLAEQIQAPDLAEALLNMDRSLRAAGITPIPPTLIHQDLNDGNVLCSPDSSGQWKFDALIDWEGAVVGDSRLAYERGEPWNALRKLARVVKIRWLMAVASGSLQDAALPRCCAEELVEDYEELSDFLVRSGWLKFSLLPFKPVLLPVVFRYARGMSVEHWMYSDRYGRDEEGAGGGKGLTNFMDSTFPEFQRHEAAADLKNWWTSDEPRILVVGPSSSSRAAKAVDFMPVLRLAHVWAEFFSFASADAKLVAETLGSEYKLERGQTWALMLHSGGDVSRTQVRNVRDMAPLIQDFISEQIPRQAPVATERNFQQLCGDRALSQSTSRTYCLILVDRNAEQTAKALRELESSQKAYYQEVQEIRNAGEDAEEPFRIQPVRVASSGSRFPWSPAAPGPSFPAVWAEASKAWAFVLDMETRKFAAVKTPSLNELFQGIAYEDLKLSELNEDGPPLSRLFSDPETTLRREVSAILSTSLGACFAYLLVAVVVSISPELELPALAAGLSALAMVATLASPVLTRKCVGIFWCAINSSRMECQRNF